MAQKSKSENLRKAKQNKNDEFYTQLVDIENEMKHYWKHFENKIIYCNCDDPDWSNFFRYFQMQFHFLKIKKLVSTHYSKSTTSYKLEYDGKNIIKTDLKGNGDFRNEECIEILKEADIVITNPPFSLFREYVAQLIEYNKQFLIIGNNQAISYKEIFKLYKENKIWNGISPRSMKFLTSNNDFKEVNACWFTNLEHFKRNEELLLWNKYTPEKYPKFDNYNAISVEKVVDIPADYMEEMGVPITFLDKYNPNQFEIIGNEYDLNIPKNRCYLNGKRLYARIIIKRKTNKD